MKEFYDLADFSKQEIGELLEVAGDGQPVEQREAQDEDVPHAGLVCVLHVRQPHTGDHAEHNTEEASDDGSRQGCEECPELADHGEEEHETG